MTVIEAIRRVKDLSMRLVLQTMQTVMKDAVAGCQVVQIELGLGSESVMRCQMRLAMVELL